MNFGTAYHPALTPIQSSITGYKPVFIFDFFSIRKKERDNQHE